ncbi:hypothetical protein BFP72_14415 [Reichenbachiella sp. 5M10]|uniref:DUF6452 family protein n=1 Tax=Reichenbachiella sp. 5M10 TaxID=1889772 RepID=UPI000C1452E2|nr:DUF6452 family protein [Reichenbachiella sp. 5M10]PIB36507.1 hypothetical protein BFP72_14415 [Reichenbachiella sp. 5M10]
MKKMKWLVVWMFLCSAVMSSCKDDPDCSLEQPYDEFVIGFYDERSLELDTLRFDFVSAEGSDTILYNSEDTLSYFSFKLNPAADSVTYYFLTGVSVDTLQLTYDRDLEWLSERCGPFFNYAKLKVAFHTFDSVSVEQSAIDITVDENIKIYN